MKSVRAQFAITATFVVALVWCLHVDVVGQGGGGPKYEPLGGCLGEPAQFHQCALTKAKTFTPSRTPDGKPDFRGNWTRSGIFGTDNIEEHGEALGDPGGKSVVVDPADGKIPYQPWAAAKVDDLLNHYIDPPAVCFAPGSPRQIYTAGTNQILQTPSSVIFLNDFAHIYRVISTDGAPHVAPNVRLAMGNSRGRWEGNTLIVDVTNLNGKTWFDHAGNFYSDAVHVVERWTMIAPDAIHYQATIEDPKVYTRPWTMVLGLRRNTEPNYEIWESACFEGMLNGRLPGASLGLKPYFGQNLAP